MITLALAFVMIAGIFVTSMVYIYAFRRGEPILATIFDVSTMNSIDAKLILGTVQSRLLLRFMHLIYPINSANLLIHPSIQPANLSIYPSTYPPLPSLFALFLVHQVQHCLA